MRLDSIAFVLAAAALVSDASPRAFAQAPAAGSTTEVTSIEAVVGQVKAALSDVQTTLANSGLPPLKQVKLALKTTVAKKGGAKFQFWVITIGGTYEKDKAQEIDIVLTTPSSGNPKQVSTASITQELEDAIVSAAQGVQKANSPTIPLKWKSLDVQLGFTVKAEGTGGLNITIVPITADFSGDISKTAVQTLTVSFGS
jgi:hypothetical protein